MKKLLAFVIVLAALAAAGWVLYRSTMNQRPLSADERDALVVAKNAPGTVPAILSSTVIPKEGIPADLAFLMKGDVKDVATDRMAYDGEKSGYRIRMSFDVALEDSFDSFFDLVRQEKGWKQTYGSRAESAAVLDGTNGTYTVHIALTHPEGGTVTYVVADAVEQ